MSSLTKFEFKNNTVREDGLVNITALAKAYQIGWHPETVGMKPTTSLTRDWLVTPEAQASIDYLASTVVGHSSDLVKVIKGGNASGTWVHSDLAEIFAQWISVEYRFAVVQLIRTAKEGKNVTSIAPPEPQRQLAPQRDLIDWIDALKVAVVLDSPIIKALITQRAAEQLGGSVTTESQLVIVTVRANDLGYSAKQIGSGSALGSSVKKQGCHPVGKTYHGTYHVNTYVLCNELDTAIHTYFSLNLPTTPCDFN